MQQEGASGQRNIHAILQQRRLRHIHGIGIRNLQQAAAQDEKISWLIHVRIYDKESSLSSASMIFKSEVIKFCSNPSWMGFCLEKTMMSNSSILHLELWMQKSASEKAERALVWSWNLLRLRYIAEKLYHGEITFAPNALILHISGSFYSFAETFSTDTPHGNCPLYNLDEEKVSYNVFSIRRMVISQKSIAVSKGKSSNCISECESLMTAGDASTLIYRNVEGLKTNIKMLKFLLKRETLMLKCEVTQLEKLEHEMEQRRDALDRDKKFYISQRDQYDEIVEKSNASRLKTIILNKQLSARRIEVLSELAYIFPIIPYTPPSGVRLSSKSQKSSSTYKSFMICSIHLPDAESLVPKEDAKYAVGMGYVSQMLHMISFFLVIPLRYPLLLHGSQSSVIDNIIDKIQDRDRIFPLYVKSNKERFLFEYAVYLLNKDIAQIRFLLNIPTPDLRPTLVNMKSLLELAIRNSQPAQPQPLRIVALPQLKSSSLQPDPLTDFENILPKTTTVNPTAANGVGSPNAQHITDKLQDKSSELNTLREELFGKPNRKLSNPVTVLSHNSKSPSRLSISPLEQPVSPSRAQNPGNSQSLGNHDGGASFLTGLEDLENELKEKSDLQAPLDIVEARNELFKTKSGRPVITKPKAYTHRSVFERPGANNAFSSNKQEIKSRSSTSASSSSNESRNLVEKPMEFIKNGTMQHDTVKPINGSSPSIDELDLC